MEAPHDHVDGCLGIRPPAASADRGIREGRRRRPPPQRLGRALDGRPPEPERLRVRDPRDPLAPGSAVRGIEHVPDRKRMAHCQDHLLGPLQQPVEPRGDPDGRVGPRLTSTRAGVAGVVSPGPRAVRLQRAAPRRSRTRFVEERRDGKWDSPPVEGPSRVSRARRRRELTPRAIRVDASRRPRPRPPQRPAGESPPGGIELTTLASFEPAWGDEPGGAPIKAAPSGSRARAASRPTRTARSQARSPPARRGTPPASPRAAGG